VGRERAKNSTSGEGECYLESIMVVVTMLMVMMVMMMTIMMIGPLVSYAASVGLVYPTGAHWGWWAKESVVVSGSIIITPNKHTCTSLNTDHSD